MVDYYSDYIFFRLLALEKECFQIVDEHWQMVEDISEDESYKKLKAHSDELNKIIKDAFVEMHKILNEDK